MKTNIDRREWFKSAFAISTALTVTSSLANRLMAAPLSKAEAYAGFGKKGSAVKLNSNENPYGPSEKARQAIMDIISEGNRYPFQETDALKLVLAKKEGVDPAYIHMGAGSGDLLCQAATAFGIGGGSIISAFPTFPLLMNYAGEFNCRWDKINLNDKLEHDYDVMARAVTGDTKLIFICNPNNPTGTLVDPMRVKTFCEDISKKVPVYADEAYLEFLQPQQQISMVELVKKGMNVIVSRTFSKIYGLAGLRLGYIIARPELIKKIARYGGDIPINQTVLAAATASLGDESFMKLTRDKNAEARNILTNYLDSRNIFYGKSHTNFVFFPAPADGRTILKKMEEKGYLMRIWDYKEKEWCRVSIGTVEEMRGFVKAFGEAFS